MTAQMKLARVHGAADVRLDDVPVPQPGARDVLVRVHACGICGSDLGYIAAGGLGGSDPLPIGHEFAGVVAAAGQEVTDFKPGDRVAVNPDERLIGNGGPEGGMAPYILVPEPRAGKTLFALPDSVSSEEAALTEPLSVALHGIDLVRVKPTDKVAVIGAGPIGLCAVAMLRHRGVRQIAVLDREESRLARAAALGASATINVQEMSLSDGLAKEHGEGSRFQTRYVETDVFIDVAGAPAALNEVIAVAKYRARIAVIALYKKPVSLDLYKVMANEIAITGSIADCRSAEFGEAIEVIAAREIDLSPMISHRFSFEDFHDAIAMAADPAQAAKVMLTFKR
jgi:2-desacetyl-2-hydroxyethyl bacteriochlorophyllide A dehydrogenase